MNFQEWIGSLISLLAFAILLFFNKRKEPAKAQRGSIKQADIHDEEEEDAWTEFLKGVSAGKEKKKPVLPPMPVKKTNPSTVQKIQPRAKLVPANHKDEHLDLSMSRPVLRSAFITRLSSIPQVRGELPDHTPRIRKIIGVGLPNLKSLIISREVLEKPRGWH